MCTIWDFIQNPFVSNGSNIQANFLLRLVKPNYNNSVSYCNNNFAV